MSFKRNPNGIEPIPARSRKATHGSGIPHQQRSIGHPIKRDASDQERGIRKVPAERQAANQSMGPSNGLTALPQTRPSQEPQQTARQPRRTTAAAATADELLQHAHIERVRSEPSRGGHNDHRWKQRRRRERQL